MNILSVVTEHQGCHPGEGETYTGPCSFDTETLVSIAKFAAGLGIDEHGTGGVLDMTCVARRLTLEQEEDHSRHLRLIS